MAEGATCAKHHVFNGDDASADLYIYQRQLEVVSKLVQDLKELQKEAMAVAELDMFSDSHRSVLKEMILNVKSEYIDLAGNENILEFGSVVDLEMRLEDLEKELQGIQVDIARTSKEIETLAAVIAKDANYLEDEIFSLGKLLMPIDSKVRVQSKIKDGVEVDPNKQIDQLSYELEQFKMKEVNWDESKRHECYLLMGENNKFEGLQLRDQLNQKRADLKDLQRLDNIVKRVEAIKMVEDLLCDTKVIAFIDGCIRLSIKTYIPILGGSTCQYKMGCVKESFTIEHELLIKVGASTMTLEDVEIFPNDVPIDDITNAAKALGEAMPLLMLLELRGQLEYLVREIQHRIYCCTLRAIVLQQYAKTSRNSFQYSERDQIIIVHVFGGIKAFIKVPQSWPIVVSPLKLLSLKPLDQSSGDISLVVLCRAVEILNSLELSRRCNLVLFIDAVEQILLQQMHKTTNSGRMA